MSSRDERINNLAATLKSSGLAKSEVQAKMMAEEMIGVEENVQKRYDEEHARAHEYLSTTKNLGDPRVREAPSAPKPKIEPIGTRLQNQQVPENKPIMRPVLQQEHAPMPDVHTDVNLGSGTLKDLMLNQIKEDNHEVKTVEQLQDQVNTLAGPAAPNSEANVETAQETPAVHEEPAKLDAEKLTKMMEEDGPMEEHTREIPAKPTIVKPKDEYVENTVDLSDMFNYSKRQ